MVETRNKTYKGPANIDCREQGSHARGVSHTGYLAHENSKGEARGRRRHKNNSKRVVRNMGERNAGTKRKNPPKKI